jgi:hypothetical protein
MMERFFLCSDRPMTDLLAVGLASWIIQDGNYGEFERGDHRAFALEFSASTELDKVKPEGEHTPFLERSWGAMHKALGKVVHMTVDWWAIDAGILIYNEAQKPPRDVQLGDWVTGEIYVGIDPFDYFERLARHPDAPALIYDWKIEKIEMQTSPFIKRQPWLVSVDLSRPGLMEIETTNAWVDDGGLADYVLHCRRLDGPARRTRGRTDQRIQKAR